MKGHIGHVLNEAADSRARAAAEAYQQAAKPAAGPGFTNAAGTPAPVVIRAGTVASRTASRRRGILRVAGEDPDEAPIGGRLRPPSLFDLDLEADEPETLALSLSRAEHTRLLQRARGEGVSAEELLRSRSQPTVQRAGTTGGYTDTFGRYPDEARMSLTTSRALAWATPMRVTNSNGKASFTRNSASVMVSPSPCRRRSIRSLVPGLWRTGWAAGGVTVGDHICQGRSLGDGADEQNEVRGKLTAEIRESRGSGAEERIASQTLAFGVRKKGT